MATKYADFMSLIVQRFSRSINWPRIPHPNGGQMIRLPGFKYDDFNRAGLLNIARLNRVAEVGRTFDDYGTGSGTFFLMFGRHWMFHPVLYDRAAVEFPMIFRTRLCGIGRSSLDFLQTFEDEKDSTLLASLVFRIVNIDPAVRGSSVPFSEEYVKHLSPYVVQDLDKFPKLVPPNEIPKDAFTTKVRVRYDDMDFLFHTNQGSYLGFSLECAAEAAERGYYSRFNRDIAFCRARRSTGVHLAESHAGDELEVCTWQDGANDLLLNFAVCREKNIIYYSQIEYFGD